MQGQPIVSKRLAVYLADGIADLLEKFAEKEGRSSSSLGAFLIEKGLREMEALELQRANLEGKTGGNKQTNT